MPKVDTTVRELVDMVGRGELRLPEMQRRYVWKGTRVRDLIDSLYRGYPSGAVLVWETDQDAPTRDLDVAQATSAFATHKLLLDGQQRVTSLRAVLCDEPIKVRGRRKPIDILFNLEHPEGGPVELTEVDDDADSPLLADEEAEDEDEADDFQQRLRKRTFVVASKALAAIPTWIRVSDVFNPKKGAGTTDVSVFRIAEQFEDNTWIKGKLAFYSAVSDRPGVDALDDAIVARLGNPTMDVRTMENDLIKQHGLAASLKPVLGQVFEVYRKGWSSAYRKLPLQSDWYQFGLFVLGGGSRIDAVAGTLTKSPWPGHLKDRTLMQNEFPADLFEMPRKAGQLTPFAGDGAFLLVAYGLSFMGGDVPPAETPEEMPDYEPPRSPRRSIDQDEYYPK